MTRIIAMSDTHLNNGLPENLVELIKGADLLLHAGDFVTREIYNSLADLGQIEAVRGNADPPELKRLLPERKVIEVEGVRIGLVHRASHSLGPGAGLLAREMNADVLVFGHLHKPLVEHVNKLLICPGSPILPRMSPPTVAEIEINSGVIKGSIIPLGAPTCDYFKYAESFAKEKKI
jgi:putative phosphoesterase